MIKQLLVSLFAASVFAQTSVQFTFNTDTSFTITGDKAISYDSNGIVVTKPLVIKTNTYGATRIVNLYPDNYKLSVDGNAGFIALTVFQTNGINSYTTFFPPVPSTVTTNVTIFSVTTPPWTLMYDEIGMTSGPLLY